MDEEAGEFQRLLIGRCQPGFQFKTQCDPNESSVKEARLVKEKQSLHDI
jgi:hypothetical protein